MSTWYAWTFDEITPWPVPTAIAVAETMSERELVRRAQAGELEAFEALYRDHYRRIYALCLRMVADPTRAEDLTQEAFVRAWKKLRSFHGRSSFATWLHRVTVNLVLGHLRRQQRHREDTSLPLHLHRVGDAASMASPDRSIDLDRAIAGLPTQARVVFVLHDVEGWGHSEIAQRMGIAEGTSKAHLHRARRALRKALGS